MGVAQGHGQLDIACVGGACGGRAELERESRDLQWVRQWAGSSCCRMAWAGPK